MFSEKLLPKIKTKINSNLPATIEGESSKLSSKKMDANFKNNEKSTKILEKIIKLKKSTRRLSPALSRKPSEVEMQVFVRDKHTREPIVEHSNAFFGPYSAESFDRLNKKNKRKVFDKLKNLFLKNRKSKHHNKFKLFAFGNGSSSQKATSANKKTAKKQIKLESKAQNKAKQIKQDKQQQNQQELYFKSLLASTVFTPTVSKIGDETAQKLLNDFLVEKSENKTLEDILNYINELNEQTFQKYNPVGETLSDMSDRYLGLKLNMKKDNNDSPRCNPLHQKHKQYREALQKTDHEAHHNDNFKPPKKIDTSIDTTGNVNYFLLDRQAYHKKVNSIINAKTKTANNNKQVVNCYLKDCSKQNKKLQTNKDRHTSHKTLNINSSNSPTKWILKPNEARGTKNLNSNFSLNYFSQSSKSAKSKLPASSCFCLNESDEELFRPDESRYQTSEFVNVGKESQKCNNGISDRAKPENSVKNFGCRKIKNLTSRSNVTSRPMIRTNSARLSSMSKKDKFTYSRDSHFNRKTPVTQFKTFQTQKTSKNDKSIKESTENNGHVSLLSMYKPVKQENVKEMNVEPLKNYKEASADDNGEKKNIAQEDIDEHEYVLASSSIGNIQTSRSHSVTRIRKLANPRPPILVGNETRRKNKKIMFSESVKTNHESMTSITRLKSNPMFEDSKTIQLDSDDDYYELTDRKSNISPNNAKHFNIKDRGANQSIGEIQLGLAVPKGRGQKFRLVKSFNSETNNRTIGKPLSRNDDVHDFYHINDEASMEAQNLLDNRVLNTILDSLPAPKAGTDLLESLNRWRDRYSISQFPKSSKLKTDGRISADQKSPAGECVHKKHVVYTVNLDNYQLIGKIADGSFGRVLFAKITSTNKKCAIKMYNKKVIRGSGSERIFDDNFLAKYIPSNVNRSPFMVHLIDILQTKSHYFFVTEFMDYGNLEMVLVYQGRFEYTQVKFYSAGILLALNYLHDQQLIHRNLKLGNVLVDSKGYPRLSDFGRRACTFLRSNKSSSLLSDPLDSMEGIEYIAPEVFSKLEYDYMIDLWAFAVCVVYMLTGELQKNWKYLVDFLDEIQDKYNSTITSLVKSVINWNHYTNKKYMVPAPEKACRTGYAPLNYDLYRVIKNSINTSPTEIDGFQQINFSKNPSEHKLPIITSKSVDRDIFQSKSHSQNQCTWRATPVSSEHQCYQQPQVCYLQSHSPNELSSGVDCKNYKLFGARNILPDLSVTEKPSPGLLTSQCKIEKETTLSQARDNLTKPSFSMHQMNVTSRDEKARNELEMNLIKQLDTVNILNKPLIGAPANLTLNESLSTNLDPHSPQSKHQSLPNEFQQYHQLQEPQPTLYQPPLQLQNQYHSPYFFQTPLPQYLVPPQHNQYQSQNYQQLQNHYQYTFYPNAFPRPMQNQVFQMMPPGPFICGTNGYNPYLQLQQNRKQQQNSYAHQIKPEPEKVINCSPIFYQQPQLQLHQIQQLQQQQQQQQPQSRELSCQCSQDMSKQSSGILNSSRAKSLGKGIKTSHKNSLSTNQINSTISVSTAGNNVKKFQRKSSLGVSSASSSKSSQHLSSSISEKSEKSRPEPSLSSATTEDDLTPNYIVEPRKTISQVINKMKNFKRHSKTIRLSKSGQPVMGTCYEKNLIGSKPSTNMSGPLIYPLRSDSHKQISEPNKSKAFL